jgi:hypothetical protein
MKKVSIAFILTCMVLTGSANSAALVFDGLSASDPNFWVGDEWEDGDNWISSDDWSTRGVLPNEFDYARIRNSANAILNSFQTVNTLRIGSWNESGEVTINGGGLRVKNQGTMGWGDGFCILSEAGTTGVLTINGGANVIDRHLVFGSDPGTTATLNMYGGTLDVGYNFPDMTTAPESGGIVAGNTTNTYINIYGGTLDTIYLGDWSATTFQIYFDNTDGKMIVGTDSQGDPGQRIPNMISWGQITAATGLQIVHQKVETTPGNWDVEIFAEVADPSPVIGGEYTFNTFYSGSGDPDWGNASNWFLTTNGSNGTLPDADDLAQVRGPGGDPSTYPIDCILPAGANYTVNCMYIATDGVGDASLTVEGQLRTQRQDNGIHWLDGQLIIADTNTAVMTVEEGAQVDVDLTLAVGWGGNGTLNMNGGVINIGGNPGTGGTPHLYINQTGLGTGHIEMKGGTITTETLQISGAVADGTINFSGPGTIIINHDWNDVQGSIDSGQITNAILTKSGEVATLSFDCPSQPTTDINGDCVVDTEDLMILSAHWLEGTE